MELTSECMKKTKKVLRACYKAATTWVLSLAQVKETDSKAQDLYDVGLQVIDPTCKRVNLKTLLSKHYTAQENKKAAKSRCEYMRTWLQNAKDSVPCKARASSMLVLISLALREVPVFSSLARRAAAGPQATP